MKTKDERIAQLENELGILKAQLSQKQEQENAEKDLLRGLDRMPDGAMYISVRDLQTDTLKFQHLSGTWEKIMGVTFEDSLADIKNVFAHIEPSDMIHLQQRIEEAHTTFVNMNVDVRYHHPVTKRKQWLNISSYPRREGNFIFSNGFVFDVTARKEAEQKFIIQNERLRAFDKMPDGALYRSIRDLRTQGIKFDYVSSSWEKITGVTAEDTIADLRVLFANMPAEDIKLLMHSMHESDDPKKKFNVEVRYTHPETKKEQWFQISSYPRREGDFVIADGFVFDITTRKEAELKLEQEKERMEALGNNLPDGALCQFVLNTQTGKLHLSYASNSVEAIIGIPVHIVTSNFDILFAMIHPDDVPFVMHETEKSAKSLSNFHAEFRLTVQGKTRWVQLSSRPHQQDALIIWDGTITDISSRKKTEHELETEKKRFQALGDNIPDSALYQFIRDNRTGQMRMSYVSGTWESVSGLAAETTLDDISKLFDMVFPDDLPVLIQSIEDSARTMTDHKFETRLGNRWVNVVARPRNEGIYALWDGIMTNISDRKETEHELKAEKNRLQTLGDKDRKSVV